MDFVWLSVPQMRRMFLAVTAPPLVETLRDRGERRRRKSNPGDIVVDVRLPERSIHRLPTTSHTLCSSDVITKLRSPDPDLTCVYENPPVDEIVIVGLGSI